MKTISKIEKNYQEAVQWRRKLHQHPQPGWLEFYATAFVAEKLSEWGYEIQLGSQIVDSEKRLFVPPTDVIQREYEKTLSIGFDKRFLEPAKDGLTGVVGILKGKEPGPQIAFRFDIDALEMTETTDQDHRANIEGYVSQNLGYAHMCGHDAHTATGLLLARYFAENKDMIKGTIKFIFQPDEEKLSGAKSMVAKDVVDGVDYLIGGHVGANLLKVGQIGLNVSNMLAVTRSEITFKGKAAHSTGRPDQGKNALLGSCTAISNLHAISRHGLGVSMVNVGKIQGGSAWNIIADHVVFWLETRAETSEINDYLQKKAKDIISGAAEMYDLEYETEVVVESKAGINSQELIDLGTAVALELPYITEIVPQVSINASEDFVAFAEEVQRQGGKSLYAIHGTPVGGGQHSISFDIDEKVIFNAATFYASLYESLVKDKV